MDIRHSKSNINMVEIQNTNSVWLKKLIKRFIPVYIVRIFYFWYFNQLVCVRWNQALSYTFRVTNGVWQGGISSSLLFNVSMNDLSLSLRV